MKKWFYILIALFAISCTDDGGGIGGCVTTTDFVVDPLASKSSTNNANEELVLEYLDADGNNLIENNIYKASDISLGLKNNTITDVVDLQNKDTKNLVRVFGFSEGKNNFSVTLSDTETDTMELYATEVDFSSCTGPVMAIDSVFYNGEKQAVEKVSDWLKKVSITKQQHKTGS